MARYIPLQDKLDEIEEQGRRLRRRLDYLKGERDFLVDTLLHPAGEGHGGATPAAAGVGRGDR